MVSSARSSVNGSRHDSQMFLPENQTIMVTDRIMEKNNVKLRQAAPASDFSIIGFFPIRVQNIPEVIRTFFFHNSWRWPLFP